MAACAVPHARAPSGAVGARRLASRRLVASRAGSRRGFLARADAESTRRASAPRRPEGDLETWTLRARAAAFACVASAVLASGAAAEPAVASREANAVAAQKRDRRPVVDDSSFAASDDASGALQGFVCVVRFSSWQRSLRFDSSLPQSWGIHGVTRDAVRKERRDATGGGEGGLEWLGRR